MHKGRAPAVPVKKNKVPEMTEDDKSGIWVAAVSFVVCFFSFYGDGLRNGWFTG
jgi:hypothetical protein